MNLEDYRREIDRLNREIVDAVSRRMNVVDEIGALKREKGMEVQDPDREEKVRQQFERLFEDEDLPPGKGHELADLLMEMARERQKS